jgi:hypothetical protein
MVRQEIGTSWLLYKIISTSLVTLPNVSTSQFGSNLALQNPKIQISTSIIGILLAGEVPTMCNLKKREMEKQNQIDSY